MTTRPSQAEILFVSDAFDHMGNHSGYQKLICAIENTGRRQQIVFPTKPPAFIQKRNILPRLRKHGFEFSPAYYVENLWAEILLLKKLRPRQQLIHYLYAEHNLGIGIDHRLRRLTRNTPKVATIHQPIAWWQTRKDNFDTFLNGMDLLVVLSSYDRNEFASCLKPKIVFIPHGVDTEYFTPGADEAMTEKWKNPPHSRCLFVGQWLRDFATLYETIKIVNEFELNIVFDLVIPRTHSSNAQSEILEKIVSLPNTNRYISVSDAGLLKLYREASVLLLPLLESTANNSILEAMACGLPIVTNKTNGMDDYCDSTCARVLPSGAASEMAYALVEILGDHELQAQMSRLGRKRAVDEFSWFTVGNKMSELYQRVLNA